MQETAATFRKTGYQYPFIVLLIAVIAGILLQQFLAKGLSIVYWWLLLTLTFLSAVVLHLIKSTSRYLTLARSVSLCCAVAFFAAICSYHNNIKNNPRWYGHYLQYSDALLLKINEASIEKHKTILLPVTVQKVRANDRWQTVTGNLKLYIYKNGSYIPPYKPGDRIIIPNKLVAIKNTGNPFAFDYAAYAARNSLLHQAFLSSGEICYLPGNARHEEIIQQLRAQLMRSIAENVRDSTTASLIDAVLLNERAALNDDLWRAYSVTGIVHIIAISGAHIAIFCSIILWLFFFLRSKNWNWLKYIIALAFVWFYIVITHYPPSAVRAAIMFTIYAFALITNREHKPVNTLAATGFLMLLYNPNWLYDVGVQLSFLAVLSIMIFYKPVYRLWLPRNKIIRRVWELLALSIAVQVLVFPLVIYYFHQFPLWCLIANIPAAIFSFLLMVGSLMLFVCGTVGHCVWLGDLLIAITKAFHASIQWMARLTPASFRELYIDKVDFWLLTLAIILLSIYCFNKKSRYLFAGLSALCLLLVSFVIQDIHAVKQERLIVYNVSGQTMIDCFTGKKVMHYNNQPVDEKTYNYNLLPARLGFRAIKKMNTTQHIWLVRDKTILVLDANYLPEKSNHSFPVDYLIITKHCTYQPEIWQQVFHPVQIILDSSLPRWKAQQWKDKLEKSGAAVYSVGERGAFILDD